MRVAIDSGPLTSGHRIRGVGFYTKSLIQSIDKLTHSSKSIKIEAFDFLADEKRLSTGFYDVLHIPYFNPFIKSIPSEKYAKVVVTIHDVIPLIYPDRYVPGIRGKKVFDSQLAIIKNNVDAVITDTESSKKDIVRFIGLPERQVYPTYLAPRDIFKRITDRKVLSRIQKKFVLPNKFVLYVGDINYNKNISSLIYACDRADVPLVIVGKQATEINELTKIKSAGIKDILRRMQGVSHPELAHFEELDKLFATKKDVIRLGYVEDDDLVGIYNLATLYCQPSYYEGFGLPVLEAMASGTAVVASKTQAIVEIAQDAALYASPYNIVELSKVIESVLNDSYLRAGLIRQGEKRVADYSWEKTAIETLEVYKKTFHEERILARKR